jgi:soluble lytic murein transglycosylase-like protein
MIQGIKAVFGRIYDIQKRMDSLNENTLVKPRMKSFEAHLKERLGSEFSVQQSESEKAFVPLNTDSVSSVSEASVAPAQKGYQAYANESNPLGRFPDTLTQKYDEIIGEAARRYDVPEHLIRAVITQESGFRPDAVSKRGAVGLMQLMPKTASALGIDLGSLGDPKTNVMGGTRLLSQLLGRYNGELPKALSAYNAGTVAVDEANGVPNIPETKNYVERVLGYYQRYGGGGVE